jgi:hypothetical protein
MRRIRSVLVAVALAASMLVAAAGPAQAPWEGFRTCNDWYFTDGYVFRFSHCSNPYYVQDVVKAHARLHLYRQNAMGGWEDPSSVDSITINGWTLYLSAGLQGTKTYYRAAQSRGSGPPYADFYSAGVGLACNASAWTDNWDESVRLANGHAHYGPNNADEVVTSPISVRPCD